MGQQAKKKPSLAADEVGQLDSDYKDAFMRRLATDMQAEGVAPNDLKKRFGLAKDSLDRLLPEYKLLLSRFDLSLYSYCQEALTARYLDSPHGSAGLAVSSNPCSMFTRPTAATPESPVATVADEAPAPPPAMAAAVAAAGAVSFEDEELDDFDDFAGYGVIAESSADLTGAGGFADLATSSGMKSQATLTDCSHTALPEVGELLQDRVKLMLCGGLVLLHSVALIVLDVLMMRRRCSPMLGGSFAVFAAALAVAIATTLLVFVRVFGRRAIVIVACVWTASLTTDACWVCLTFPRLDISSCLGTAMIGVTAVGLVACPASLVAFVIMHSWYRVKPSEGQGQ